MKSLSYCTLFIALCSLQLAGQALPAAGVTLFEGARLILGDGQAPIESSAFIVADGRFSSVGRKGELILPPGAVRVDLTCKTVMPAMVDVHSHMGFLKQLDGSMAKANFNRENLLDHLNRYAYHGFSAAISMGTDMGELPYKLREEVIPGAALFRTVGRGLAWPGSGPNDPARNDVPYVVTTVEQARRAVQELAPHRPDFVKIWVDDRNHTQKKLTPDLYGAAVDEAHKHNLRAIAHVFDLEDAKGLLRAGIDGFTHLVRDKDLDDEFMQLVRQHPNVFFTPTSESPVAGSSPAAPRGWTIRNCMKRFLPARSASSKSNSSTGAPKPSRAPAPPGICRSAI